MEDARSDYRPPCRWIGAREPHNNTQQPLDNQQSTEAWTKMYGVKRVEYKQQSARKERKILARSQQITTEEEENNDNNKTTDGDDDVVTAQMQQIIPHYNGIGQAPSPSHTMRSRSRVVITSSPLNSHTPIC
eukprot:scaffold13555_cov38-Cyclotella_meneghiniana.AAC.1